MGDSPKKNLRFSGYKNCVDLGGPFFIEKIPSYHSMIVKRSDEVFTINRFESTVHQSQLRKRRWSLLCRHEGVFYLSMYS